LADEWKEFIIILIYEKNDKTNWSKYCRMSLLSTSYKHLYSILLAVLSPFINKKHP
jgi:hypothetical protein